VQECEVKHLKKAIGMPEINVDTGRQENKTTQRSTRGSH